MSRSKPKKKQEDKKINAQKEKIPSALFRNEEHLTTDELASYFKRIGTEYYCYNSILTAKGTPVKILKKWRKTFIKDDHGVKVLNKVEKFFDFVLVPDNTEKHQRNVKGCYNLYEPMQHTPEEGDFPHTNSLLKHIFGDYLNIGLDYLTLLFLKPAENLPALCLVSVLQKTGKSTFLRWLCRIFGDNAVILGNEDFASNFNTSWISKLIIGIDESFIEKRIIKEKIKRLVTDDTALAENKGVDKARRDFIGKFILLSNNESNFIQMDEEDSRFFVLKIPAVKNEDPFLEDKLSKEIPAFLHFLSTRELFHQKESRLWFKPADYETEALKTVVKSSKSIIEKTMLSVLAELMDNIEALSKDETKKDIKITPTRLADKIKDTLRYSSGLHLKIADIFKDWGLKSNEKSERYEYPYFYDDLIGGINERLLSFRSETGKYYTIPFSLIEQLNND